MPAKGVDRVVTDHRMTDHRVDVAVVGGGVIGLACAWRLAQRGRSVAVVDPSPGRGASGVAAGMLAPVTELHPGEEPLLHLGLESARRYAGFAAEVEQASGVRPAYRTTGALAVALDAGDRAVLEEVRGLQQALGLQVQSLTRAECRRLEPMLSPAVHAGVLVHGDHQVDSRRLLAALLVAAERAGVRLVRELVAEVTTSGGAVTGVLLDGGSTVAAATVVLAAGCRSGEIGGLPDLVLPPVRPVKGQILRLHVPPGLRPFLRHTVRGTVHGAGVYLVPREDGELVVGATQEERGFDVQVTAGGVYGLLRDAHALVPGVSELALVESAAGSRPGSPDNAPIVGPTPVHGLVVATGHHRGGVLLAPVTADAVARLVVDGALPALMEPFSPGRFGAGHPGGRSTWTSS